MKKLVALLSGLFFLAGVAEIARADGCYICAGGGYARYRGKDTFAKRREAQKKCNCKVTGTTSSCTNPKCTVAVEGLPFSPFLKRVHRIVSAPQKAK